MEDRQVSLKQVLDTVDEMPVMKDNNGMEFIEKSLVKTRIGLLPSAQPVARDTNVLSNDLVNRQAAIDVFDGVKVDEEDCTEYDIGYNDGIDFVVSRLSVLPSVQPDGIPLEWINKHLEWLDNCDNDFAQLAKVSIRAMVEIWKKDRI